MIAGRSYATAYAYDAASHLAQVTYPSGRIVIYARNSLGQVTAVTTKQNATAAVATVATGITWKPMSNLIAGFTHGNGLVTTAGYDQDYRLTSLIVANGASNVISLGYAYADKINLTAVNDNVTSANSVGLSYTPANRLGTATGPWGSASYSYDGVGNRLTETITSGTTTSRVLSYPAASNLLSGITENGAALRTYGYDAAGNITSDTRPGEAYALRRCAWASRVRTSNRSTGSICRLRRRPSPYNVRNRPVSVTRNSAAWATYAYNALEQMVSRVTSAPGGPVGTVQYVYDTSGHLIAEADASTGATLREYLWLAANDNGGTSELPLATVTNVNTTPVLYTVHADHLGRPIRMTDAAKATVWQATYKPFGEVQSTSGTVANDLRFPGQFFEIETGLTYNWHRHYDPLTGRYTQADPLRFVDGPSVFAYAGGSPYGFVDQSGLIAKGLPDAAAGALIGAMVDAALQYYDTGCIHLGQVGVAALSGALSGGLSKAFSTLVETDTFAAKYGSQIFVNTIGGSIIGQGAHGVNYGINQLTGNGGGGSDSGEGASGGASSGDEGIGSDTGWGAAGGAASIAVTAMLESARANNKFVMFMSIFVGAVTSEGGNIQKGDTGSGSGGCSCSQRLGGLSWSAL